jgi:hypothetical protein
MLEHFMVQDLIGSFLATVVFLPVAFLPGYVLGWMADTLGFRERSLLGRFAICIPLSIAFFPIFTYVLWRWSLIAVFVLYGALCLAFLVLMIKEHNLWKLKRPPSRHALILLAIAAGWIVIGLFCLIDLQIGDRLYFPVVSYDNTLRTAITASISRTGVPPQNPYYFPGRMFPLRYHYFWFLLCSLVEQLGGPLVSPRHAVIAGTLWAGIALMAVIALYMRYFQPKRGIDVERRIVIAVALLSVTGLDILPIGFLNILTHRLGPTIEGWNGAVMAWVTSVIWSPHQVAGLVATLTGFLVVWRAVRLKGVRQRAVAATIGGLCYATGVGMSIYVTFAFAIFMAMWLFITLLKKHWFAAALICISGFVALAASAPYLLELRGSPGGAAEPFVKLDVVSFTFVRLAMEDPLRPVQAWWLPLAYLAFLPLNYLLELGFFFAILDRQWKRMRRGLFSHQDLCGLTIVAASILTSVFVRSSVISANDLARRSIMLAQFMLLLWAADMWHEGGLVPSGNFVTKRRCSRPLMILLVLGVAGTLYEVTMVRFFPILSDRFGIPKYAFLANDQNLGKRTYAVRQVYEALKKILPGDAVIQQNPNADPGDLPYGLYADRQAAAESAGCGVVFGGDASPCKGIVAELNELFQQPGAIHASEVDSACRRLSIDALVVKDTDTVWGDKESWVWKNEPYIANGYARAFLCGGAAGLTVAGSPVFIVAR